VVMNEACALLAMPMVKKVATATQRDFMFTIDSIRKMWIAPPFRGERFLYGVLIRSMASIA
jgi:hypothetical protein